MRTGIIVINVILSFFLIRKIILCMYYILSLHQKKTSVTFSQSLAKFLLFIGGFLLLVTVGVICKIASAPSPAMDHRPFVSTVHIRQYPFSLLLPIEGRGVMFYLENKTGLYRSGDEGKGVYAVFRDVITKKILKEQKLSGLSRIGKAEHRWFSGMNSHYLIINSRYVYQIKPSEYTLSEVTSDISSTKLILNSNFSLISFVEENNGEGFRLKTDVGKEFFYFPKPDILYTEKAYRYVAEGQSKTLLSDASEKTYYLFLNKENKTHNNVAQLMKVNYIFNDGGPESKLLQLTTENMKDLAKYRISSCQPITDERICFSPTVLYYDEKNILITYRSGLLESAPLHVELLDTGGKTLWSKSLDAVSEILYAVRTNNGFMCQTSRKDFFEISVDSKNILSYTY